MISLKSRVTIYLKREREREPKVEIRILSWLVSERRKALGLQKKFSEKDNITIKMTDKNKKYLQEMVNKLS